jgi:hypothetical protein
MNPEDLSLGDLELFEEATGQDLMEVLKPVPEIDPVTGMPVPDPENKGRPKMTVKVSAKAFVGLMYIAVRREEPDITLNEVRKMRIADFDFDMDVPDDASNPTEGSTPNDSERTD